jgi:hypothetical protein
MEPGRKAGFYYTHVLPGCLSRRLGGVFFIGEDAGDGLQNEVAAF